MLMNTTFKPTKHKVNARFREEKQSRRYLSTYSRYNYMPSRMVMLMVLVKHPHHVFSVFSISPSIFPTNIYFPQNLIKRNKHLRLSFFIVYFYYSRRMIMNRSNNNKNTHWWHSQNRLARMALQYWFWFSNKNFGFALRKMFAYTEICFSISPHREMSSRGNVNEQSINREILKWKCCQFHFKEKNLRSFNVEGEKRGLNLHPKSFLFVLRIAEVRLVRASRYPRQEYQLEHRKKSF